MPFGLSIPELFVVILGLLTLLDRVLSAVSSVKDPNAKQDTAIQLVNQRLDQHTELLSTVSLQLSTIRDNHLAHLSADVRTVCERLSRVEGVLDASKNLQRYE